MTDLNPEALEEAFGAYNDAARRKLDTENNCEIHKAGLYAAITAYLAALPRTDLVERLRSVPVTDEVVGYISLYGGRCRDCADENGVCPGSGLPCDGADKAIQHVLSALNYGIANGYLAAAVISATGGVPDGWVLVPVVPTRDMLSAAEEKTRHFVHGDPWYGTEPISETQAEECYAAMLAAAPPHEEPKGDADGK